jgi:putative DNA primase/helicase
MDNKFNFAIFPIQPNMKIPYSHILDKNKRGGFYTATKDMAAITNWELKLPKSNWAIATGKASNVIVIDIDVKGNAKGFESFKKMTEGKPEMPKTYTVKTPSSGLHFYFKYRPDIKSKINIGMFGGVDIKTDGGYVLIPKSTIHDTAYKVVEDTEIQPMPDWLAQEINPKKEEKQELIPTPKILLQTTQLSSINLAHARKRGQIIYDKYVKQATEGTRNKVLLSMLCQMRDNIIPFGIAEEYTQAFVIAINATNFTLAEGLKVLSQAYKYPARLPSFKSLTEEQEVFQIKLKKLEEKVDIDQYSIAEFLAESNLNIKHIEEKGWIFYDEKLGYWDIETGESKVINIIAQLLRDLKPKHKENKTLLKKLELTDYNIKGIKNLLKSITNINYSDFVPEPYLINTKECVVDLRNCKTYQHHRDFKFTCKTEARYDSTLDQSFAYDVLAQALEKPEEIQYEKITNIMYFLMCLGYMITGERCEETAFYVFGPARAGKSLIVNMLYSCLGGFAGHINIDSVCNNNNIKDNQNFQLANAVNKRVVVSSETDKDTRFDGAKIKALTGGEPVTCAFKFKNLFTTNSFPKMLFTSNHELDLDANDDAVWTRFRVFFFPNSHKDNPDTSLKDKLWKDRDAFFSLICEASSFWYSWHNAGYKLGHTPSMNTYMSERLVELDAIGSFLNENNYYMPTYEEYFEKKAIFYTIKELYQRYRDYCGSNFIDFPLMKKSFSAVLKNRGFRRVIKDNERGYLIMARTLPKTNYDE